MRGRRDAQEVVTRAEQTFADALDGLGPMLGGFIERVRATAGPAEVEVEFAIRISADANVIVARTGGEANFRVTARWAAEPGVRGTP